MNITLTKRSRTVNPWLLVLLGLWLASGAEAEDRTDRAATDFIKAAARANLAEIRLAEAGARKAQDTELRQFSEQLKPAHQHGYEVLKPFASAYDVLLPKALSDRQEQALSRLNRLTGEEFDRELARELLQEHVRAARLFDQATRELVQPKLREYAASLRERIEAHLTANQQLARRVGLDAYVIAAILDERYEVFGAPVEER